MINRSSISSRTLTIHFQHSVTMLKRSCRSRQARSPHTSLTMVGAADIGENNWRSRRSGSSCNACKGQDTKFIIPSSDCFHSAAAAYIVTGESFCASEHKTILDAAKDAKT